MCEVIYPNVTYPKFIAPFLSILYDGHGDMRKSFDGLCAGSVQGHATAASNGGESFGACFPPKVIQISSLSEDRESLTRESSVKDEKIAYLTRERDHLRFQVEMLRRMQFGQKRERFEGAPNQTELPFDAAPVEAEQQQEQIRQKIEYTRKRPNHKGRAKLPAHLPVEEIEIHPDGDLSEMVCIGKEISEELECEPARFYIKRYIRYKYAAKNADGVCIARLPERVIDKGIPGAGLLAMILTGKYIDICRCTQNRSSQGKTYRYASSTIEGWTKQTRLEKTGNRF
ncbi:hypothetical protein FQR65_LT15212 [Abscondita terminalis]|nr:hypothetical protein FQR65_LT15212 [Abscondita terminalis]